MNDTTKKDAGAATRRCRNCNESLPREAFPAYKKRGTHWWCKECIRRPHRRPDDPPLPARHILGIERQHKLRSHLEKHLPIYSSDLTIYEVYRHCEDALGFLVTAVQFRRALAALGTTARERFRVNREYGQCDGTEDQAPEEGGNGAQPPAAPIPWEELSARLSAIERSLQRLCALWDEEQPEAEPIDGDDRT